MMVLISSLALGALGSLLTGASTPSVSAVGSLAFKAGVDTTTLAISPEHVGNLERAEQYFDSANALTYQVWYAVAQFGSARMWFW